MNIRLSRIIVRCRSTGKILSLIIGRHIKDHDGIEFNRARIPDNWCNWVSQNSELVDIEFHNFKIRDIVEQFWNYSVLVRSNVALELKKNNSTITIIDSTIELHYYNTGEILTMELILIGDNIVYTDPIGIYNVRCNVGFASCHLLPRTANNNSIIRTCNGESIAQNGRDESFIIGVSIRGDKYIIIRKFYENDTVRYRKGGTSKLRRSIFMHVKQAWFLRCAGIYRVGYHRIYQRPDVRYHRKISHLLCK